MPVKVGLKVIEIWNSSMEEQIASYEKEEPQKGQIVFYGPSHYTRWSAKYNETPMREVIKGKSGRPCVVNRGFGSSCAEHQLYYYPRAVRPLEPKALVYASYGNGGIFGYTAEETFELAQRVVAYARADFPDIHIYLCGPHRHLKPETPENAASRESYAVMLRKFAAETPACHYIDIMNYKPLLRDDIFIADGVHYNSLGYRIYADMYREALKEELDRF